MRLIGHLEAEASAKKFGDYLYVQGIENQIEAEKEGEWGIWIHAEEKLEHAKRLLADFRENPASAKFQSAAGAANELREQRRKEQAAYEKRMKDRRHLFAPLAGYGFGPLTFVLICLCVVVYIVTNVGAKQNSMLPFYISEYDVTGGGFARLTQGLPEIKHGEIWRLITPIFLHHNFLHIFFNMLWLRDLGSMIEARRGSLTLAILVVVFAVVSNLSQYAVSGPAFLGMSGVVYGLLGYIWIWGKVYPGAGLFVHPTTMTMMMIWLVIGFTGVLGTANTAHLSGLLIGIICGYLASFRHR